MDELSPLFQEIEFHERYRGYDPDEVDAFVDRVARAAALVRGRISELQERVEAAEARGGLGSGHSDTEETLTRTLVLAQRTADAAIAEAHEEADRLTAEAAVSAQAILSAAEAEASAAVDDAAERAGRMMAEAETDRRAMMAEAEALASEAAVVERDRLAAEVSELNEYRAFLADDIAILERHLAEERQRLTTSVAALTDLLDSPEAFRSTRPPATSGVEPPAVVEPIAVEPMVDEPIAVEPIVDEPIVVAHAAVESATIDLVAAEAQGATAAEELDSRAIRLDAPEPEPEPSAPPEPAFAGMTEGALVDTPAPRRLVTAADLESGVAPGGRGRYESSGLGPGRLAADGGPITEAMPVLSEGSLFDEPDIEDDPFLSQLRDAVGVEPMPEEGDDEALSAFFDQEDEDGGRTWFGRRR